MIENLHQLRNALRALGHGECFDIPKVGFANFWPNPDIFKPDDHLEPNVRATRWCDQFDVTVREKVDPPGLHFFKPHKLGVRSTPGIVNADKFFGIE